MPTPFSHLVAAQRLLDDERLAQSARALLDQHRDAFLLGSIAADARVETSIARAETHFYAYDQSIVEHPWQVMLRLHPQLETPRDNAHRVFLAAYVAHLSMDEIWTLDMLETHFVRREWGTREQRFLMLHIILSYMDERDYVQIAPWQYECLKSAQSRRWLPFLPDDMLMAWRNLIARQIKPGSRSETLDIFSKRIHKSAAELRAILDNPARMQRDLWDHISRETLAQVEVTMYDHAREQMLLYLNAQAKFI